jgi:hypothetical protein
LQKEIIRKIKQVNKEYIKGVVDKGIIIADKQATKVSK